MRHDRARVSIPPRFRATARAGGPYGEGPAPEGAGGAPREGQDPPERDAPGNIPNADPVDPLVKVDIWSDVVCPWCYIGKRRFEVALARFDHRDDVEVVWRSFELDPHAPRLRQGDYVDRIAAKYGMSRERAVAAQAHMTEVAAEEGLDFKFDHSKPGNTFDAHRLLHLAAKRGVQDAVKERLLLAYFTQGEPIGDPETLVRLGAEAGLDSSEAGDVLSSDTYTAEVRADEQEANEIGISGVPFFVVDRKYAVSGAQPADLLVQVLERSWKEAHPLIMVDTPDSEAACEGDSCAV